MSLSTEPRPADEVTTAADEFGGGRSKLFAIIAIFAMVVGAGSMLGGIFGAGYTYQQALTENITIPGDAVVFAEGEVRGPLTMWSQSEVITRHQLDRTEGLRFAEMPRMVEQVDPATGEVVIGEDGEPVMVPNQLRESWNLATTLTTALGLGIIAYAVSAFAFVVGLALMGLGWVVFKLRNSAAVLA